MIHVSDQKKGQAFSFASSRKTQERWVDEGQTAVLGIRFKVAIASAQPPEFQLRGPCGRTKQQLPVQVINEPALSHILLSFPGVQMRLTAAMISQRSLFR
jgi:hypothetical protein